MIAYETLLLRELGYGGGRPELAEDLAFRQLHPELIEAILASIGRIDPTWRTTRALRSA